MTVHATERWLEALERLRAYRPESNDEIRIRTEAEHARQSAKARRESLAYLVATSLAGAAGWWLHARGDEDLMSLCVLLALLGLILTLRATLNLQPPQRATARWLCTPVSRTTVVEWVPGMLDDVLVRRIVEAWPLPDGMLRHIELDLLTAAYPAWRAQHAYAPLSEHSSA